MLLILLRLSAVVLFGIFVVVVVVGFDNNIDGNVDDDFDDNVEALVSVEFGFDVFPKENNISAASVSASAIIVRAF